MTQRSGNFLDLEGLYLKPLKSMSLAQDAFSNGDRIVAESYYQYAEHYQRVINEIVEETKDNSVQELSDSEIRSNSNEKPSRTERALNAKMKNLKKSVQVNPV